MSYTDDAVKAKLSALNETSEAIVTVAQWIMFHRKYAMRTADLWLQRLKESNSPRRLNLLYLANEVVQQSKARRKTDFLIAFAPIIVQATTVAYQGATLDVQQKIRRMTEVWRQRQIFDMPVQQEIENRIDELDRTRGVGKRPALGGSLFSAAASSAPPEYQALLTSQASISKAEVLAKPAVSSANAEYDKHADPSAPTSSPPVQAAKLNALLKALSEAEGAVAESIKARKTLIKALQNLSTKHQEVQAADEAQLLQINARKTEIAAKGREVEEAIMRGLSDMNGGQEPPRPEAEPLTPPMPPVESITPTGTPKTTSQPVVAPLPEPEPLTLVVHDLHDGVNADGQLPPRENVQSRKISNGTLEESAVKRQKINATVPADDFADFADDGTGIDADVEALLGP